MDLGQYYQEDDGEDTEQTEGTDKEIPVTNDLFRSELTGIKYHLRSVISEGGFGTVYEASYLKGNLPQKVAMKIEKWDKSMQANEVVVLQAAQRTKCLHFPELFDYGSFPNRFNFIAMTLLGRDLYRLRKNRPNATFSLSTSVRMGIQTLNAIEELHTKCRYVCRDIKPSNFVIGPSETNRQIFIVDFGLCRKFLDRFNNVLESRGKVGWRGTFRYGSLQCHLRMDLGRKDDLESWFYMLVEATMGKLPWANEKDRDRVQIEKIRVRTINRASFLSSCPGQFERLMNKIDSMSFSDDPPYSYFTSLLENICAEHSINSSDPYDWEPAKCATSNQ